VLIISIGLIPSKITQILFVLILGEALVEAVVVSIAVSVILIMERVAIAVVEVARLV
jgi:hypothetical protein